MQRPRRPFAGADAGSEYFTSEAHYRLLAAEIRDRLQHDGGCVVLTGDPAPNSDLLVRQLTVVGTSRCRATAVKCQAQMSAAGLMESYRRLVGGTIEAMSRRVASWSMQAMPAARGQELDILVLDGAENLSDEVLSQVCSPSKEGPERWPPRLLAGSRALAEKLAARAFAASDAIGARFDLHHLAVHETGSFIRFQLAAGEADALDIFKPSLIELIETYADGDPAVVNSLARRLARIVPHLAARRAARRGAAPAEREESERTTEAAIVVLPTAAAVTPNVVPPEPEAEPVQPARGEDEAQASPSALVEGPAVAPPLQASESGASIASVPSLEPIPPARTPEEPSPPVAAFTELSSPLAEESAEPPIPPEAAEASFAEAVQPHLDLAAAPVVSDDKPVAEAPSVPAEMEIEPAEIVEIVPAEIVPAEIAPDAIEEPIVSLADTSGAITAEGEPALIAESDHAAPVARPPRSRWSAVALGCAAAAALIIVAVMTGARYPRGGETYLDAVVKFARNTHLSADVDRGSIGVVGASAPVPKDPDGQRLRTTTDTPDRNLLIAQPTPLPPVPDAKVEPPPAPLASSSSRAMSLPPEPPAERTASRPATESPRPAAIATEVVVEPPPAKALPSPAAPPKPAREAAAAPIAPLILSPPPSPPVAPLIVSPLASPPVAPLIVSPLASPPVALPKPEMRAPLPAQAGSTAAAARPLSAADLSALLRRGDQLLASGDIIAARHYFELVSEAGDSRASLRLGKTYDPAFLQENGVRGIAGDPAIAKSWYLKAIGSGDKEADLQLLRLMTLYPE